MIIELGITCITCGGTGRCPSCDGKGCKHCKNTGACPFHPAL